MALVKRLEKGSPLTAQEMDDNLDYLEGIVGAGTSGSSGTSGTSGTTGSAGTSGIGGSSGSSGSSGTSADGTSGSSGSSGTSAPGITSGTSGQDGGAGTDGVDGTSGTSGTSGSGGTSGTSPAGASLTLRDVNAGTNVTSVNQINFSGATVSSTLNAGTALVTISAGTSGGGGGTMTFQSGSGPGAVSVTDVTTVQVGDLLSLGSNGFGVITLNARTQGGGGSAGSAGADGTSGSSGTSGTSATGFAGSNGTSGSSGTQGQAGTDGTHGTSGSSGTSGGGGTNGTGGSSGSSGLSTTLSMYDMGITEVNDVRYIKFSNEFTVAQITQYTASVSMSVAGGGGSANWDTLVNKPVGIVSASGQLYDTIQFIEGNNITISTGSKPVGSATLNVVISANTGSGGSGTGVFTPVGSYYTTTNYLEIVGGLLITESIGVGSQSTNALTITGSVDVLGSVSASALHVQSVGQPYLTSPSSINLQAESGSVNIIGSVLRLASYTDVETGSLIAQDGDMIYNTTSNKFWGYANGAWVSFH